MEPLIEPRDLYLRLGDDEVLVIDCREEEAWSELPVRIPGALKMTLHELSEAHHVLPDDELIILCGADPDGSDARSAWRILRLHDRDAVCLRGGLHGWIGAGYPTEPHHPRRSAAGQNDRVVGGI
jgi:rhodanese-related sulfurtransferase